MKIKLLIAVLAAAALPMAAQASEDNYVGINLGSATTTIKFDNQIFNNDQTSTASKIYYGHRFTPMLGIEAGATFQKKSAIFDDVPENNANFKTHSMYVAATGTFSVNPSFAFTAKAGAAFNTLKADILIVSGDVVNDTNYSETKTSLMYGVGVIWNITPKISVVAEAENYGNVFKEDGVKAKMAMVTVGARFAF